MSSTTHLPRQCNTGARVPLVKLHRFSKVNGSWSKNRFMELENRRVIWGLNNVGEGRSNVAQGNSGSVCSLSFNIYTSGDNMQM
jgi:hypothetical protein